MRAVLMAYESPQGRPALYQCRGYEVAEASTAALGPLACPIENRWLGMRKTRQAWKVVYSYNIQVCKRKEVNLWFSPLTYE